MRLRRSVAAVVGGVGLWAAVRHWVGLQQQPSTAEADSDAASRLEMARFAYGEVLAATKHQDDKLGRLLTAIAFLTGATAGLATRPEFFRVQYDFDGEFPLPAVLAAAFIALVGIAVAVLLAALGKGYGRGTSGERSLLFFLDIASQSEGDYVREWTCASGAGLKGRITNRLPHETHKLATRLSDKNRRTLEAQAVLTLALLCFVLAFVLGLNALSTQPPNAGEVSWDLRPRVLAAAVIAAFGLVVSYSSWRTTQAPGRPRAGWAGWAVIAAAAYPVAMIVADGVASEVLGAVVALAALVVVGVDLVQRFVHGNGAWYLLVVVTAALGAGVVVAGADRLRLLCAMLLVVVLELPRLLDAQLAWHDRRGGGERGPAAPVTP